MEMLRTPLAQSEEMNRAQVAQAEKQNAERIRERGDPDGNRHERRVAARRARQAARVNG